jgi:hypothetical protein
MQVTWHRAARAHILAVSHSQHTAGARAQFKVDSVAVLAQTTPAHLVTLSSFLAFHHTIPPRFLAPLPT